MNIPRIRPAVPVIPGPEGTSVGSILRPPCVACETSDPAHTRRLTPVGQDYLMLCDDVRACCLRTRVREAAA